MLKELEITAKQTTTQGKIFEFVRYEVGQDEPFPPGPLPKKESEIAKIQTLSIPRYQRHLPEINDAAIVQVLVNYHVLETHFAIYSEGRRDEDCTDMFFLQTAAVARGKAETDALYSARFSFPADSKGGKNGTSSKLGFISCEVKQDRERLIEEQIIQQVAGLLEKNKDREFVVPVYVKHIGGYSQRYIEGGKDEKLTGLFLQEYQPVFREECEVIVEEKKKRVKRIDDSKIELVERVNRLYQFSPDVLSKPEGKIKELMPLDVDLKGFSKFVAVRNQMGSESDSEALNMIVDFYEDNKNLTK